MRSGRSATNGYQVQSSLNRGNQDVSEGMSFENGLKSLKAKLDVITLKILLDTITHMLEQKRNANVFNSYHVICDLCGGYHATHTYMQAQNVDYFDEFEYCNPYFDQNRPNWGNSYGYG